MIIAHFSRALRLGSSKGLINEGQGVSCSFFYGEAEAGRHFLDYMASDVNGRAGFVGRLLSCSDRVI